MDYLSTLNEKQLEAVTATEGYVRVIAGAGSGKTKLLVSRYTYLVCDYGINPTNILCVTFTNKAAGEMKRRIRDLIGPGYDTALICTYHGFCVRVLREDIEKIFYPKEFQILDKSQQKSILADIYQKFELKLDYASFEKITKQIAAKKADRRYVEKMCCTDKCRILPDILTPDDEIIEEYLQRQKQLYAMDFDDLMYFTLHVFDRHHEVLEKWQDKLNYIQVDEFQDSSSTEMELVDRLAAKHKNLMIVGDPDQNIYEWRGSDVKLLVDFDKAHVPTNTIFLNQNYRSTPQILRCANTLIAKNKFRLEKDLYTHHPDGAQVYHYHTKNEFDEADKIIGSILDIRRKTDCSFADFAVLYRSGFLSRVIEKKFTENGIPYEIYGGVKFYHRMEIQDIMAYLRLVAFGDDISFKRIINTPRRRFGRTKLQYLMQLQTDSKSLYETLKDNLDQFRTSGAEDFVRIIEDLRSKSTSLPLYECVEKICDTSGYEKYIRELGDMERFENLSEFKRIASEYEKNFGENVSLTEFINQISLQSEDDSESTCDMVKLMTIHASKGLEFPTVFVMGMSEGIFPSAKTVEERKQLGLEEERRLCYVAITRAEKHLFLSDSEGYSQNGAEKLPSRFFKEIGEENYVRIGTISRELQQSADNYAAILTGESPPQSIKKVGDTVIHPAFGEGEIIGIGRGGSSYKIRFKKLESEREISAIFFDESKRPRPYVRREPIPPEPSPKKSVFKQQATVAIESLRAPQDADTSQNTSHTADVRQCSTSTVADAPRTIPTAADILSAAQKARHTAQTVLPTEDESPHNVSIAADTLHITPQTPDTSAQTEQTKAERAFAQLQLNTDLCENSPLFRGRYGENPNSDGTNTAEQFSINPTQTELPADSYYCENRTPTDRNNFPKEHLRHNFTQTAQFQSRLHNTENTIPSGYEMVEEQTVSKKTEVTKTRTEAQYIDADEEQDTPPAPDLSRFSNLWKRDDVPHEGWVCTGVTDLGAPTGVCEMCGRHVIRYVHHMMHPHYGTLDVGCVCAGRMEGDEEGARQREQNFKNRESRRQKFHTRKWKTSKNNNSYIKIKDHIIVLYYNKKYDNWKYSLDNVFCPEVYQTRAEAVDAAFDALEAVK